MGRTAFTIGICLVLALGILRLSPAAGNGEAGTTSASNPDPLSTPISMKEKDVDLRGMLTTIFEAMGANYLLTDEVSGRVYLGQRNTTAREILDLICAAKGLNWWKKGDTYVVSAQASPGLATGGSPAGAADRSPASGKAGEEMKTRRYEAQYWNPRDLAAHFNPNVKAGPESKLWGMDYTALFAARMMQPGKGSGYGSRAFVDTSLRPFNFGISRLGESGQFPAGAAAGIGYGGVSSLGGAPLGGSLGAAGGAAAAQTAAEAELLESGINLAAPFANLLPRGMTAPMAYEPLNILVFEATDEAYDRFLEMVRIFDQKPKQVLLEVQFITMSTSDAFALGLDWFWNVGQTSVAVSGLSPAGFVNLRVAKGQEFGATLSTLLTTGRARVINAPRVATMNNFPATIAFIDQVPYVDFQGAIAVPNGGIIGGGAVINAVSVPTQLTILPRINGDDSVTALLQPTVSTQVPVTVPTPTGGTQSVPLVKTNLIDTLVNIKDGETMVIGGFVNLDDKVNYSKVPLLGDIPVLGSIFFTRTERNKTDSELLIFVTPHVLRDETAAVTVGPY